MPTFGEPASFLQRCRKRRTLGILPNDWPHRPKAPDFFQAPYLSKAVSATSRKRAKANLENLHRVFTVPEAPDSTLGQIERKISENLLGFLQEHVVAVERDIDDLERDFSDSQIPEEPTFVSDHTRFLLDHVVAQSVHTASPRFVGHMTSTIPYFMLPLSKIMIALNQNLVKTETSKAFTPLERQVVGMLHRLVYDCDDAFYSRWMHDSEHSLGAFGSGGTIANITALWMARNRALGPRDGFEGVAKTGLFRAMKHYGYEGLALVVSERGHYSLAKAADVLGLGREDLVTVPTDVHNKVKVRELEKTCKALLARNVKPLAIIGIAGSTETGSVDPLSEVADLAQEFGVHFHVDAAWGGPVLMSEKHRGLLKGIERADSVTLDAHKQLYVPMGAGILLLKDPTLAGSIIHHAQYIIRRGSKDLGATTLEGSRPGMAMLVHSALRILGRRGFALLIERGIQRARALAKMIDKDPWFQLISAPETNILTYRLVPPEVQAAPFSIETNELLNRLMVELQKNQRERGQNFVSRTTLTPELTQRTPTVVFRVVLANPLTTDEILREVLDEQLALCEQAHIQRLLSKPTSF
jgi:glutamate decarboxylase